jgi:3-phenylpropionate/trans-cinnamate dioxygenase ferredoxin reductase component
MSSGTNRQLVIIGGGLTAHSAAMAARHNGYSGAITILSDEPSLPYDRTPLSKGVLQSKQESSQLGFQPDGDYGNDEITVLTEARAQKVDLRERRIEVSNGDTLVFDDLLIATGATPIRLNGDGFDLKGVHYLRTIEDAENLKRDMEQASSVVVIGAGFIGSEVAASARMLGKSVTLVDMAEVPMSAAFHPDISAVCAAIHEDQGVTLRMNARVEALKGSERVEQAVLDDGSTIDCDLVVVGIGVRPNVELFEGSELEIDNGIVTDEYCRTSVSNVYAAGDVANWWHPEIERRIRVEHFDNAGSQGTFVGNVIAGTAEDPFAPIPYFWSDQYDTNIQFAGFPSDDADVIIRGDTEERSITAFYLQAGKIQAAVTVNNAREFRSCRRLVAAGAEISPETLRDPDTDIRKLSREYR